MTIPPARYAHIAHEILDRAEALFDQLEDRLAPLDARDNPLRAALLREASDIMGLPRLCGSKACRRAGKCRRQPKSCLARYAPLVSPDVRAGVVAKLRAESLSRRMGVAM